VFVNPSSADLTSMTSFLHYSELRIIVKLRKTSRLNIFISLVSEIEIMADELQVEFKSRPRQKGKFELGEGGVGGSYVGEYVDVGDGKKLRDGNGRHVYASGSDYDGDWKNDIMHGNGTYKFVSGDVYKGCFENGLFSGKGTYRFKDGSVYEGTWKNHKMHGEGVYLTADKRRLEGKFLFGHFTSATSYVSTNPPVMGDISPEQLMNAFFGGSSNCKNLFQKDIENHNHNQNEVDDNNENFIE
jgi:hypothetical protein